MARHSCVARRRKGVCGTLSKPEKHARNFSNFGAVGAALGLSVVLWIRAAIMGGAMCSHG